jgi:hypothetical protein
MKEALAATLKDAPAAFYPRQLVKVYPRIVDKIHQLWGTPEIEAYFQELMLNDRGNRQGFSPEVLTEVLNLRTWYRSLLPPQPRSVDSWADMIGDDAGVRAMQDDGNGLDMPSGGSAP